ncbi:DUF4974 domain-containing protein [Fulvivirgaceae bacterium BMA12]|uniref:DUF4974 domain-containing protein n=1 Tax=Agaribacillus aureus TaxID=3051825 RepID=A0ABT8L8K7_9BACT|nr:DUF4974 domain-containing protein [Fulvivirgaceae bacterium BMA12]
MNKLLIRKFFKKQCNEEELQQVYAWLHDPKNNEEVTALLKNSWHRASDSKAQADTDMEKLRYRILEKLDLTENHQEVYDEEFSLQGTEKPIFEANPLTSENNDFKNPAAPVFKPKIGFSWLRVAAVIIILEIVAFAAYHYLGNAQETTAPAYTVKTTLDGQKYTLFLKDGSKVILNSNSSLRYSDDYGETSRDLILEGEAFFEVAENPEKPFRVTANNITTVALGTSFNIMANPQTNMFRASLATGKVKIWHEDEKDSAHLLVPGEELVFAGEQEGFNKTLFDFKERLSWKDGIIYFHESDLFEAVEVLEKWYGVEFEVLNPEKADTDYNNINGEFKNESLSNVLKVMSFAKGFTYSITGKKVVIKL